MHTNKHGFKFSTLSMHARVLFLVALLTSILVPQPVPARSAQEIAAIANMSIRNAAERELFGMVVRDPFYEYNTDPVNFHEAANRTALENQAVELAAAGVKWIRMEFFADYDGTVKAGDINWSKYDWFIRELAPKYGLKVLALLNLGMVTHDGQTLRILAFNDPPDGGAATPEMALTTSSAYSRAAPRLLPPAMAPPSAHTRSSTSLTSALISGSTPNSVQPRSSRTVMQPLSQAHTAPSRVSRLQQR